MSGTTRRTGWHRHGSTLVAILAGVALSTIACVHVHERPKPSSNAHVHKGGPPPHAPAHGYRQQHDGNVELVFDAEIGVYVVVGHKDHYHDGEHYFRWARGQWRMSTRLGGGWVSVSTRELPPGLRAKKSKHKPKRGHGPPAKHGY